MYVVNIVGPTKLWVMEHVKKSATRKDVSTMGGTVCSKIGQSLIFQVRLPTFMYVVNILWDQQNSG